MKRKVIKIDEALCNGCGQCVTACHEGAIQMVDGKARLVSDVYCDGLGDCIGECPVGAITFEEREAEPFDAEAVARRLQDLGRAPDAPQKPAFSGCPGMALRNLGAERAAASPEVPAPAAEPSPAQEAPSRLANWPLQLALVPPQAPWLRDADIVLAADCVAFSVPNFQQRYLNGEKPLIIACPKLDDAAAYREKLAEIFRSNTPRSVEVLHMEVPCCHSLARIVEAATQDCGIDLPVHLINIDLQGREKARTTLDPQRSATA